MTSCCCWFSQPAREIKSSRKGSIARRIGRLWRSTGYISRPGSINPLSNRGWGQAATPSYDLADLAYRFWPQSSWRQVFSFGLTTACFFDSWTQSPFARQPVTLAAVDNSLLAGTLLVRSPTQAGRSRRPVALVQGTPDAAGCAAPAKLRLGIQDRVQRGKIVECDALDTNDAHVAANVARNNQHSLPRQRITQ